MTDLKLFRLYADGQDVELRGSTDTEVCRLDADGIHSWGKGPAARRDPNKRRSAVASKWFECHDHRRV